MIVPLTIHRKKKRLDRLGLRSLITSRQSDSFGRISPFLCFYIVYQVSSHVFTVTQNTTYRKFYQCNSLFFISLPITLCALTLPLSVTRALKTIGDDSGKRCNLKKIVEIFVIAASPMVRQAVSLVSISAGAFCMDLTWSNPLP